ncbi:hypothetical protein PINS_up019787 [Pythium insidiosum]|nr:hypothetical protein PINS_up019787 [Pythium insidiosum]
MFALERRDRGGDDDGARTSSLSTAAVPSALDALHAERARLADLLQVHPLSPAMVLDDDSAPVRVDAVQWGRELRARARDTVTQRRRRLRSSAVDPSALLGLEEEDVEVLLRLLATYTAMLHAQEDEADHDQDDANAAGAQDSAKQQQQPPRDRRTGALQEVRDAVGLVAAELLLRWTPRPRVLLDGAVVADDDTPQRTADEIIGFLLQFRMNIGAFHAFHLHKLVPSVVARAFRHTQHWRCSVCARKWSVRSSSPSGPGNRLIVAARARVSLHDLPIVRAVSYVLYADPQCHAIASGDSARHDATYSSPTSLDDDHKALIGAIGYSLRERVRELQLYRAHEMAPLMEMLLEMVRIPGVSRCIVDHEVMIKDKATMLGDATMISMPTTEKTTATRSSMWMPQYISASQMRQHTFLGPFMAWTSLTTEFTEIRYTQSHLLSQPGLTTFIAPQWMEAQF